MQPIATTVPEARSPASDWGRLRRANWNVAGRSEIAVAGSACTKRLTRAAVLLLLLVRFRWERELV